MLPPWAIIIVWQTQNIWRAFWSDVTSVIRDSQQMLTVSLAVLASYGAVKSGGLTAVVSQIAAFQTWEATLIAALPMWILVNAVLAPFRAKKLQDEKGRFIGNQFVYNTPELLDVVEWRPTDNGSAKPIVLKHPEKNSLLRVSLDFYPKTDRIHAMISWSRFQQFLQCLAQVGNGPGPTKSVRAHRGKIWLMAESRADTVPVLIRVYCHGWYVGKGEE